DATNLPFANQTFDAAMTIHVAMNIAAKDKMYLEARRVLKPGGIFAVYDVLQGEGGEVRYPGALGTRPVNQPSRDDGRNEISSKRCGIQTAGYSGLDRRGPEFFRKNDRANGKNRHVSCYMAALSR